MRSKRKRIMKRRKRLRRRWILRRVIVDKSEDSENEYKEEVCRSSQDQ
jgi:hypothetical protein